MEEPLRPHYVMRNPRGKEINMVDEVPVNPNDPVFLPIAHYLVEGVSAYIKPLDQKEYTRARP